MKVNAQKIFQELVSYVEFPMVIYINQTGKIIAKNRSAEFVIGKECRNVKELFGNEVKLRFQRVIKEQVKQIFYNVKIKQDKQTIEVDVQINAFAFENQHVMVCIFEQSYKMMYDKYMSLLVPRVFYKTRDSIFRMANRQFLQDNNIGVSSGFTNEDITAEEIASYMSSVEADILTNKKADYNSIHKIRTKGGKEYFITLNRIPVLGRDGEALGIFGCYNILLNRDEYKGLFDATLRQKQLMSRIISGLGSFVVSWIMQEGWPIEYVSSNFNELGYAMHEIYDGVMHWARIIHPMDFERIEKELEMCMDAQTHELPTLMYRIRKGNGRYVWIEDKTYSLLMEGNTYLREGMFRILPEECYKELEKKFERGVENESHSETILKTGNRRRN